MFFCQIDSIALIVLVHNLVQQSTQTDMRNTSNKTKTQEILFQEVNTKSFYWPSILLTQGYESWVVARGVIAHEDIRSS
jgi:hypothetical protein